MNIKLLTVHYLEFLSLKGSCTGSSESTLVIIPHCWKSQVAAHTNQQVLNPTMQQKVLPSMIHLITQLKRQPQRNTIQAPSSKTNHLQILIMKRASTQENLSSGVCTHMRRPAYAFVQSDQRLCCSHFGKMPMLTNFNF